MHEGRQATPKGRVGLGLRSPQRSAGTDFPLAPVSEA